MLFLVTWIPLRLILTLIEYPLVPQLFLCYTKVFEIPFDIPKILSNLLVWNFLFAFIMINPISIVIILASFVTIIFETVDSICCECSQSSVESWDYLSGSDVMLNMSWFSTKLSVVDCAFGIFNWSILDQNVCFWSFVLEIIIPLHLSFELFRWFHNSLHSHSFFLWLSIDTHLSSIVDRLIHCWIIISDSVLHN